MNSSLATWDIWRKDRGAVMFPYRRVISGFEKSPSYRSVRSPPPSGNLIFALEIFLVSLHPWQLSDHENPSSYSPFRTRKALQDASNGATGQYRAGFLKPIVAILPASQASKEPILNEIRQRFRRYTEMTPIPRFRLEETALALTAGQNIRRGHQEAHTVHGSPSEPRKRFSFPLLAPIRGRRAASSLEVSGKVRDTQQQDYVSTTLESDLQGMVDDKISDFLWGNAFFSTTFPRRAQRTEVQNIPTTRHYQRDQKAINVYLQIWKVTDKRKLASHGSFSSIFPAGYVQR
ncbi:hypothetical protein CIHG_06243 [Coccidioides immitis H538.4]|uniref:Uncharacterized protein n=1 Tax=Coccidioides immitis H538.4 TaxID=396776 RepID=A0A0J8ULL2_COCIT|nr:hypothetical protein CIHG_06243 [Coccidioides immitis H538.4]